MLYTGIGWEDLPQEPGFRSAMTFWRRLWDWREAAVVDQLDAVLLAELYAADQIDWYRAIAGASHVRAEWACETGPSLFDRGKTFEAPP